MSTDRLRLPLSFRDKCVASAVVRLHVNGLSVHVIGTVEELYALEDEWRTLVADAGLTLPFRTFEWNAA